MNYQLGLIGSPIKHSLSPWIHSHLLEKAGLQGTYQLLEVEKNELFHEQMKQLKASSIHGFNVTVPYKEAIIPFLDHLDASAAGVGAVNTVVIQHDKWIGYNTDGIGYVRSLKQAYPKIFSGKNPHILIIGAGGAARGIYDGLARSGMTKIDIANRTTARARNITHMHKGHVESTILKIEDAELQLGKYDVIIQTTSVGMKPDEHEQIISLDNLQTSSIVSDIVYQPIMTSFLLDAKNRGAHIHHGHTMLLYQAQAAFEIWTGKNTDVEDLEKKLQLKLEGN
ncbi:shikimate dehydrogenase [Ornithinibacillus gellani]|uniref:shikimate dehydrogenase n=1 Tax=Ornithinibacillus gellani TaxID=2293253 RepID=UPI000F4A7737|nr:shikimate dehydrogenase [Ornithinibacillus gellani]TQS74608.1 shikimate dehydrogenase [Ornithinibacillus gellani]